MSLDLERFVPFRLNRLADEVSRRLAKVYGERFGIDIPEWRVIATLGAVVEREPFVRAQDIANQTRMHKSKVSRAVTRLMARGWIERQASASDRREAPLQLTPAGVDIYHQLVPIVLDFESRLLQTLGAVEHQAFERALGQLEDSLRIKGR